MLMCNIFNDILKESSLLHHINVCMFVCVCMYLCMYVCMYACMYVCVYVCMNVCMYDDDASPYCYL